MGIQRVDSSDSMSSAATGRDNRKPCARWHPYRINVVAATAVSTPSATICKAERISKPNDRPDNRQILWVGAQVAHESRVDLEHIDRKGFQVRQDGVAGAEVVDGDLDPHLLQLREGSASGFDVANHSALGDLQAHRVGIDAELVDDVRDNCGRNRG